MKEILLLLLLAVAPAFAQTETFNPIGKWAGIDEGETVFITFDAEGYVIMQKGDEVIGGKSFEMEDVKGSMTYTFDPNGNKYYLDMIITVEGTDESRLLLALYKVVNPNEIIIALEGFERPSSFNADNSLTFKRVPQ